MNIPKIHYAEAINEHTLLIEFSNQQKKKYDITPLLKKEMFAPLKNPAFFKNLSIEKGGYAVIWNDEVDISEYELWSHGTLVQTNPNDLELSCNTLAYKMPS